MRAALPVLRIRLRLLTKKGCHWPLLKGLGLLTACLPRQLMYWQPHPSPVLDSIATLTVSTTATIWFHVRRHSSPRSTLRRRRHRQPLVTMHLQSCTRCASWLYLHANVICTVCCLAYYVFGVHPVRGQYPSQAAIRHWLSCTRCTWLLPCRVNAVGDVWWLTSDTILYFASACTDEAPEASLYAQH